jgi:predicted Zn-dependent protease
MSGGVPNWRDPSAWPPVLVVPYGAVPLDTVSDIAAALSAALSVRICWGTARALPAGALDASRGQHRAAALLADLAAATAADADATAGEYTRGTLGVTAEDIFVPEMPFVLGASDAVRRVAVLSLARTRGAADAQAEALHHVAHSLALGHCYGDARCVMHFSSTGGAPDDGQRVAVLCEQHALAASNKLR